MFTCTFADGALLSNHSIRVHVCHVDREVPPSTGHSSCHSHTQGVVGLFGQCNRLFIAHRLLTSVLWREKRTEGGFLASERCTVLWSLPWEQPQLSSYISYNISTSLCMKTVCLLYTPCSNVERCSDPHHDIISISLQRGLKRITCCRVNRGQTRLHQQQHCSFTASIQTPT